MSILSKLIEHYKDEKNHGKTTSSVLKNFEPEVISIPDAQLNLQAIFVDIKDIETCKRLIDLSLQFLSENMPLNSMHIDEYQTEYQKVLTEILYMFECYSADLKLSSLKFFVDLLSKYNEVNVTQFHKQFPDVCEELLLNVEAMVQSIDMFYEKGEINGMYLNSFGQLIGELLNQPMMYEKNYSEIVKNICSMIINMRNSKLFTKELILQCLSFSKDIMFPESIISLQNMDASEIEMVKDCYCKKILISQENSENTKNENWCCNEVMSVIKSVKSCEDSNIDTFVIAYHLQRCSKALQILQTVHKQMHKVKNKNNTLIHNNIFGESDAILIWKSLLKLIELHHNKLIQNSEIVHLILDITFNTVALLNKLTSEQTTLVSQILCLQISPQISSPNLNFRDDIKLLVLKYLMATQLILKVGNDSWSKTILFLLNSLSRNKSIEISKQVMDPISNTIMFKIIFVIHDSHYLHCYCFR